MSQTVQQDYRLGKFFEKYRNNFPKLLCVNLLFGIPLAVFIGVMVLITYLTGQLSIYIAALAIPLLSPFFAALTYIAKKLTVGQEIHPVQDFKKGIKDNWKYFLINSILIYIISVGLYITFSFYRIFSDVPMIMAGVIMTTIVALFFLFMEFTIPVMAVSVDLKFMQIIKNSVFLIAVGFANNIKTLLSLLFVFFILFVLIQVSVLPVIAICFLALVTLTLLPVLLVYIVVFNSYQTIEKNIIDPYIQEHGSPDEKKFDDNNSQTAVFSYDELERLSKGDPDEYVSLNGRMLKRSTVAKMAQAHKNDI